MKKVLKIIMVVLIIVGIALSISNFISFDLHAKTSEKGIWNSTVEECEDFPRECNIDVE